MQQPLLLISLLFIALATFFCPNLLASQNQDAIDKFEQHSAPIVKRAYALSKKQLALMDEINQIMSSTQSANAVLRSDKITQLLQASENMLSVAKEYVTEYQVFLSELDKSSSCYQEESLTEFNQMISEQGLTNQEIATAIKAPIDDADETQATLLVLSIQMSQAKSSILASLFQMTKMCYLTEAMGLTQDQVNKMQQSK
jgi:hypothetical protein